MMILTRSGKCNIAYPKPCPKQATRAVYMSVDAEGEPHMRWVGFCVNHSKWSFVGKQKTKKIEETGEDTESSVWDG